PLKAEDGVAAVALGMGRAVAGGEQSLLFCPRHPKQPVHLLSVEDVLSHSQRTFWALDMSHTGHETMHETQYGLDAAEADGTLSVTTGFDEQQVDTIDHDLLICASPMVLGNGTVELADLVMVDVERYERSASRDVAHDIARYNAELIEQGRPYLLIGVGRWGSA